MSNEFVTIDPKQVEEIKAAVSTHANQFASTLSPNEMTAVAALRAGGKSTIPLSVGYSQGGFIASIAAPDIQSTPDGNEVAYYPVFNKEKFFASADDTVAIGGGVLTSDVEASWDSVTLAVHAHEVSADPREIRIAAANGIDLAASKYELARQKVELRKEIAAAATLMAEANVDSHSDLTSGGTGTNWANYATNSGAYYSKPLSDVVTADESIRGRIGRKANTLLLSPKALVALQFHPALQTLLFGVARASTAPLTVEALSVLFNKRIIVGEAVKSATLNAATFTDVWAGAHNDALLYYMGGSSIMEPTHARTLTSSGYPKTLNYRDEKRGAEGSDVYRWIDCYKTTIFLGGACGHLFIGAGYDVS